MSNRKGKGKSDYAEPKKEKEPAPEEVLEKDVDVEKKEELLTSGPSAFPVTMGFPSLNNLNLRKFYGNEDNVEEWILHFQNVIKANNWSEQMEKCHFVDKVRKNARSWLTTYQLYKRS